MLYSFYVDILTDYWVFQFRLNCLVLFVHHLNKIIYCRETARRYNCACVLSAEKNICDSTPNRLIITVLYCSQ